MSGDPEATRAHDDPLAAVGPEATRTRAWDRPGRVTGAEQDQLRGTLGWVLLSERLKRGWSQVVMAERAGVSERTVRDLERGRVRPSDRMCRKLAAALLPDASALVVAVQEVRFREAAGPSLVVQRRRPPRAARARELAQAQRIVDAERARRRAATSEFARLLDEQFDAARGGERPRGAGPVSPSEAWPDRWPRVPPRRGR